MNQCTTKNGDRTATDVRISAIPFTESPQQRLERFDAAALSDIDLLSTILQGGGTRTNLAVPTASRLIAGAGSLAGLATWHPPDYRRIGGIGHAKSIQLAAITEIARRMMTTPHPVKVLCNRPDLVAAQFGPTIAGLGVEKFWVLCLTRKNKLIRKVEISSGTATETLAHPREVYREAIRYGATSIICVHNHPSGDPAPSAQDMNVTRQLREASRTIAIDLIDHVVIGSRESDPTGLGYYSFREAGLL